MVYKVDVIVHYYYEVEADSLDEAEEKGIEEFYKDDKLANGVFGPELYHIESTDKDGNVVVDQCYFEGMQI